MLRRLVPLFSAAALPALSGCYIDHRPNPTLEERLSADDSELRKMGGVKVRPASLAEFASTMATSPDAVAFDLRLDAGERHSFLLITKTRDPKSGKRSVKAGFVREFPAPDDNGAGRPALVVIFSGTEMRYGVCTGAGGESSAREMLPDGFPGASVDADVTGDNLPPIGDAVRRFVVRKVVTRDGAVVEIECAVFPERKSAEHAAPFAAAVLHEWSEAK